MEIYVVRHGIAIDREDPKCPPDPERYLTEEGIEKTKRVAAAVAALSATPDLLLSSPYVRATQTALPCRIIRRLNRPHSWAGSIPSSSSSTFTGSVSAVSPSRRLSRPTWVSTGRPGASRATLRTTSLPFRCSRWWMVASRSLPRHHTPWSSSTARQLAAQAPG